MSRRECLRLMAQLGIKPFEPCTAELGDWCVWSSYQRNIGRRLTNNHEHVIDTDLYVHLEDKLKIEREYERLIKKAKKERTRVSPRRRPVDILLVEHIEFV